MRAVPWRTIGSTLMQGSGRLDMSRLSESRGLGPDRLRRLRARFLWPVTRPAGRRAFALRRWPYCIMLMRVLQGKCCVFPLFLLVLLVSLLGPVCNGVLVVCTYVRCGMSVTVVRAFPPNPLLR